MSRCRARTSPPGAPRSPDACARRPLNESATTTSLCRDSSLTRNQVRRLCVGLRRRAGRRSSTFASCCAPAMAATCGEARAAAPGREPLGMAAPRPGTGHLQQPARRGLSPPQPAGCSSASAKRGSRDRASVFNVVSPAPAELRRNPSRVDVESSACPADQSQTLSRRRSLVSTQFGSARGTAAFPTSDKRRAGPASRPPRRKPRRSRRPAHRGRRGGCGGRLLPAPA